MSVHRMAILAQVQQARTQNSTLNNDLRTRHYPKQTTGLLQARLSLHDVHLMKSCHRTRIRMARNSHHILIQR